MVRGIFTVTFATLNEMDVEVAVAASLTMCELAYYNFVHIKNETQIKNRWRKRRWWMTSIHRNRSRLAMEKQLNELVAEPSGEFHKFTRMSLTDFEYLLSRFQAIFQNKIPNYEKLFQLGYV